MRGVYCQRAVWERSAHEAAHRHAIEVYAAWLAIGKRGWASGYSAALLLGLPVPKGRPDVVELSAVQRVRGQRSYPGLLVRTAKPLPSGESVVARHVPCASAARTSLDVARNDGFAEGLVLADAALRAEMAELEEISGLAVRVSAWPNGGQARLVSAHASAARESPGEFGRFLENEL